MPTSRAYSKGLRAPEVPGVNPGDRPQESGGDSKVIQAKKNFVTPPDTARHRRTPPDTTDRTHRPPLCRNSNNSTVLELKKRN